MLLKEYLNEENTVLTEGIKFFKDSKRIRKLSKKIEKKINLLTKKEEMTEIYKTVNALNEIADEFEDLERNYKNNTYLYKTKYKVLEQKYLDLIKEINKQTVINILKKIGSIGLFSAAIFFVYKNLIISGATMSLVGKIPEELNLQTAGEAFGKVVDEMSTKEGKTITKLKGEARRAADKNILKIYSQHPDLVPQGAAGSAAVTLGLEKGISGVAAGTAAITSNVVLKTFYAVTEKMKRNSLYYKTRTVLEKLNKV